MKFKIGDRVMGKGICCGVDISGMHGKIVRTEPVYTVEFDKAKDVFHTGRGSGKSHHCWNVDRDNLVFEKPETIVIYRKGNTVIALDKLTGKKAIAKCSPEDEFNFATGAKLAFDRLMGVEEVKPHMECDGNFYGEIGKPTKIKDLVGRSLCLGDTVELFNSDNMFYEECSIVEKEGKIFVMTIAGCCKNDGTITSGWKIIKKRNYSEIRDGEKVGYIKYVGKKND